MNICLRTVKKGFFSSDNVQFWITLTHELFDFEVTLLCRLHHMNVLH